MVSTISRLTDLYFTGKSRSFQTVMSIDCVGGNQTECGAADLSTAIAVLLLSIRIGSFPTCCPRGIICLGHGRVPYRRR